MASAWPDLKTVRTFLRAAADPENDAVIDSARLAAIDYGISRTTVGGVPKWPTDTAALPDELAYAATMHAARLYRRRDTVDGTIGFGELGAVRVGRVDPDIEAAYTQYAPLVFG